MWNKKNTKSNFTDSIQKPPLYWLSKVVSSIDRPVSPLESIAYHGFTVKSDDEQGVVHYVSNRSSEILFPSPWPLLSADKYHVLKDLMQTDFEAGWVPAPSCSIRFFNRDAALELMRTRKNVILSDLKDGRQYLADLFDANSNVLVNSKLVNHTEYYKLDENICPMLGRGEGVDGFVDWEGVRKKIRLDLPSVHRMGVAYSFGLVMDGSIFDEIVKIISGNEKFYYAHNVQYE